MHDDSYQMYLDEVGRTRACTEAEAQMLLAGVRQKEAGARERLLEGMLRYVIELAGEYRDRGLLMGDLVQEANLALLMAVETYESGDFHELVRRQAVAAMEEALAQQKQQKEVQEELVARINVLQKVSQVLAKELDREPTVEELADKMKMTEEEIRMIMKETLNAMSVSPDAEV